MIEFLINRFLFSLFSALPVSNIFMVTDMIYLKVLVVKKQPGHKERMNLLNDWLILLAMFSSVPVIVLIWGPLPPISAKKPLSTGEIKRLK